MKDLDEVLRQKEKDMRRVQHEIAALHQVVRLLVDEEDWAEHGLASPRPQMKEIQYSGGSGTRAYPPARRA